ncbi:hypothetical protein C1H46_040811 [Malus baccata]|uniref:Uncharacterized protein n=1 Tax=Malus baccata TaxID=106549 RepID=A0A540KI09_MALBA|nr:hypothetical protein C1H46_040811 [Malus baccata]
MDPVEPKTLQDANFLKGSVKISLFRPPYPPAKKHKSSSTEHTHAHTHTPPQLTTPPPFELSSAQFRVSKSISFPTHPSESHACLLSFMIPNPEILSISQ